MALTLLSRPRLSRRRMLQFGILNLLGLTFLMIPSRQPTVDLQLVCPGRNVTMATRTHASLVRDGDAVPDTPIPTSRNVAKTTSRHVSTAHSITRLVNSHIQNTTGWVKSGSDNTDKQERKIVSEHVASDVTKNVTTPKTLLPVASKVNFGIKTRREKILSNDETNFYKNSKTECELEESLEPVERTSERVLPSCECFPSVLEERISVNMSRLLRVTWADVEDGIRDLDPGGHWRPTHCAPLRRVAVIIPFRDRGSHLRAFLQHTHPILQKQAVEYRIFVIEQNMPYIFNKGSLMNVGYIEVVEKSGFSPDCLVFHDVDLLMESEKNPFMCRDFPTHHAAYVSKFNYTLLYSKMFGGAMAIKPDQFLAVNGYSNQFAGWGGEDDDFYRRVYSKYRKFHRPPTQISRYTMIAHTRDSANPVNKNSTKGYKTSTNTFKDGLQTVKYDRVSLDVLPTYTRILVDLHLLKLKNAEILPEETIPKRPYDSIKSRRCLDTVAKETAVSRSTCEYLCTASVHCPLYQYTRTPKQDGVCQIFNATCTNIIDYSTTDMFILRAS